MKNFLTFLFAGSLLWLSCQRRLTGIALAESLMPNVAKVDGASSGFGLVIGHAAGVTYVLTARHVVIDEESDNLASTLQVQFYSDRQSYPATFVDQEESDDIALLKVQAPLPFDWEPDWFDEDGPRTHQAVRYIGRNALWEIPQDGKVLGIQGNTIRVDLPSVLPGCSGAPLLNDTGVIGLLKNDDIANTQAVNMRRALELFYADGRYHYFNGSAFAKKVIPPVIPEPPGTGDEPQEGTVAEGNGGEMETQEPESTPPITIAGIQMVLIKGGSFLMGCTPEQTGCEDDEKPAHKITLNDFYLSKYEVTVKEYVDFLNAMDPQLNIENQEVKFKDQYLLEMSIYNKISYRSGKYWIESGWENHPVCDVSWHGAVTYCEWLKQTTGKNYRLPTEAEWDYAARGGNQSKGYQYAGSNSLDEVAWYTKTTGNSGTKAVGTKKANELGLYDMSGNVWEWCADWYGETYYTESPATDPKGPETGTGRVLRGGSWYLDDDFCRVSNRDGDLPFSWGNKSGFRLAQDFL